MGQAWSQKTATTVMKQANSEGFHEEITRRWAYVPGMMLMAIARTGELYGEEEYYDFMKRHMDLFVQEDGTIRTYRVEEYNLDQVNQGKNLFTLLERTGEEKYARALELVAAQMAGHPRTTEGGFWHKKVYPFQMWLDGLYMASPFMAQYAQVFNRPEWFDVVAHQLLYIEQKTRDPHTGLLYHGWDEAKEQVWANPVTGCSANFWSRALGWYAMAIVDCLEFFPLDHPQRGTVIGIFQRLSQALYLAQEEESGLWFQVMDQGFREGNYLETSGSSMFIYALAKGARLQYLENPARRTALKAYEQLVARFVEEGEDGVQLHNICHGAGLSLDRDGTYAYYIREKKVSNIQIGVAPFILASVEIEKLTQ